MIYPIIIAFLLFFLVTVSLGCYQYYRSSTDLKGALKFEQREGKKHRSQAEERKKKIESLEIKVQQLENFNRTQGEELEEAKEKLLKAQEVYREESEGKSRFSKELVHATKKLESVSITLKSLQSIIEEDVPT